MKKAIWLILALLLAAAANLHLCARLSAGGETAEDLFSLAAAGRGLLAAASGLRLRLALSPAPPSEDVGRVSDLLLRHTDGVVLREGCSAGGWYLGCTAEGEELREGLRRYIFGTRPPGALSGHFDGELSFAPVYTRPGRESTPEDLCLLVTGMLPVVYTDPSGAALG